MLNIDIEDASSSESSENFSPRTVKSGGQGKRKNADDESANNIAFKKSQEDSLNSRSRDSTKQKVKQKKNQFMAEEDILKEDLNNLQLSNSDSNTELSQTDGSKGSKDRSCRSRRTAEEEKKSYDLPKDSDSTINSKKRKRDEPSNFRMAFDNHVEKYDHYDKGSSSRNSDYEKPHTTVKSIKEKIFGHQVADPKLSPAFSLVSKDSVKTSSPVPAQINNSLDPQPPKSRLSNLGTYKENLPKFVKKKTTIKRSSFLPSYAKLYQ